MVSPVQFRIFSFHFFVDFKQICASGINFFFAHSQCQFKSIVPEISLNSEKKHPFETIGSYVLATVKTVNYPKRTTMRRDIVRYIHHTTPLLSVLLSYNLYTHIHDPVQYTSTVAVQNEIYIQEKNQKQQKKEGLNIVI